MPDRPRDLGTRAVHPPRPEPPKNRPAPPPIYQSAGWVFEDLEQVDAIYEHRLPGAIYGTDGVPNVSQLEAAIADLEGAEAAVVAGGGMSAFLLAFLAHLSSGDRVVASRDLYGNTPRLLGMLERFNVRASFVDAVDVAAVRRELSGGARVLIAETISNPRMRIADVRALGAAAHGAGALLAIDNTFATPVHCRPLEFGADIVIESATKFFGGHHDVVVGGAAGAKSVIDPMRTLGARGSMTPGAFEAWLVQRSLPTLPLRIERSSRNAARLAEWLAARPEVTAVHYPGLASHPDHATARAQLSDGFGAMLAFEIAGGRTAFDRMVKRFEMIEFVLSLGGVATTISHPATSSHRGLSGQQREALGIHDGFARLSVGIEDVGDIEADLARGLESV